MLDTPTTRLAHPAKEHPDYVGTDEDGYVALCAGWCGASPLRLWAETKRLEKRNHLDNNGGCTVAGGSLLGKRRAKALPEPAELENGKGPHEANPRCH
jgi:hypothetical protein